MKILVVKNKDELSRKSAEAIIDTVKQNPSAVLGLATGGTPLGTYQNLIRDRQENKTTYQRITTFNLDEYVGLDESHPNSYHQYMRTNLFDHLDIPRENTFLPDGTASDLEREANRYDKLIESRGGIHLQILGIGENGHIGFNEPGTPFSSQTHIVELTESTRKANARYFSSLDEVPTHAITMGIASIMKAKKILLLVSGEKKSQALYEVLHGNITEQVPATALRNHPALTIIADEAAFQNMPRQAGQLIFQ